MTPNPVRACARAAAATLLLASAGCSDRGGTGEAANDTPASSVPTTAPPPSTAAVRTCQQGATGDGGDVVPVAGSDSDLTVTSFDGTEIRIHWFPSETAKDGPVPTVLMGPGWSLAGDTSTGGAALFGALSIGAMNKAGYNVLTWDPRGFGESSGMVTVNAADAEGRDVQVLLDWVSTQPEALLDAEGDPRAGMVGASYGGGIQLTVGGIDCRVDALVPTLSWRSLETSLYPAETVKAGWAGVLAAAAAGADLDPHIVSAAQAGRSTGVLSQEDQEWFRSRGPGELVEEITAPTLFVQGTVDTLFTLDEAVTNFRSLDERGIPTSMIWFCGGHGTCLTDEPDNDAITVASFAWLDRYLKGDESADTGATVTIVDQHGDRWASDEYPYASTASVDASSAETATLALVAEGGAGPVVGAESSDPLAGLVLPITPAPADNAVELTITSDADRLVVGSPHLTLEYEGTSPDGPEPTRVFAQLVDDATGTVVGNQITPIPVTLDGTTRRVDVDLEVIAHHLAPGGTVTLQLVATTVAYATPRLGGAITLHSIDIELPTTTAFARTA